MWSQRTLTQNHRAHEPGRLVRSSTGNWKLWSTVLQWQLAILVLMRSIRAGNQWRSQGGGPWPPQTFSKCFFPEWIDVVTRFECVSRHGKCSWISASAHKRWMIRRWAENVPKMSRNRGNVIHLLTGKISATTPPPPPPHWIRSGNWDHGNFCYYPPPPPLNPIR